MDHSFLYFLKLKETDFFLHEEFKNLVAVMNTYGYGTHIQSTHCHRDLVKLVAFAFSVDHASQTPETRGTNHETHFSF